VNIFCTDSTLYVTNMASMYRADKTYDTELDLGGAWTDEEMVLAIVKASSKLRPRKVNLWLGRFFVKKQLYLSVHSPSEGINNKNSDIVGDIIFTGAYDEAVKVAVAYARMI